MDGELSCGQEGSMTGTQQRALIVAGIFSLAFCFGGSVFAQPNTSKTIRDRIDKIQKDIDKTKAEIEKAEKDLRTMKTRKATVQDDLSLSEKKIKTVQNNLLLLQNEERTLKAEEEAARLRMDDASRVLSARSEEYKNRLRSMYRRQKVSALEVFFSAGSMSSLLRGFTMLRSLAAADMNVLNDIRYRNSIIETEMETVKTALNAKVAMERTKEQEKNNLAAAKRKRELLLADINTSLRAQEEKIQNWNREYEQSKMIMDQLLQEQIKNNEKVAVPQSLRGYTFAGRKGKLPWPVNGKVLSGYGRSVDSKTGTVTINRGVEFEARRGEQVSAMGSGQVVKTQSIRGYGNYIMIHHFPNYYTIYAHLSDFLVNEGDIVREGDVIGLAGSTGLIDDRNTQVLIEILNGKTPENPLSWLKPNKNLAGT
jgi:murein hydrolase activator